VHSLLPTTALAIRPDDWNFPLLVHVLGAMVLVGALLTCVVAIAMSRGDARLLRVGWISLLAIGLPGWIAMRAGAEWIYSKEGWNGDDDPAWLGIGYIVSDLGGVLLLASLICGWIGVRKLRDGGGGGLLMAVNIMSVIALAAYVVAIWAMGGKPS
jgi:hypothetical protein